MADFLGYSELDDLSGASFRAVEVKEATPTEGDNVSHSRLSLAQRKFMAALPQGTAYVGVLWRDGKMEVFPFSGDRGSYRKGEGT